MKVNARQALLAKSLHAQFETTPNTVQWQRNPGMTYAQAEGAKRHLLDDLTGLSTRKGGPQLSDEELRAFAEQYEANQNKA